MSHGLTTLGMIWSLASILSALSSCTSYFTPYWMVGSTLNSTVYLGIFRRCNYLAKDPEGTEYLKLECGRYTTFADIPSKQWRVCTVTIGLACAFLLFVALITVVACCVKDVVSNCSARIGGLIQLSSGILLAASCVLYPWGWGNIQVKQACGTSTAPFVIGQCTISWGFYLAIVAAVLAFIASVLSLQVGKKNSSTGGRNDYFQSTSSIYLHT